MAGVSSQVASRSAAEAEDIVSVRSRISWGAIAAGSVLALALYFLLTLLGGAIGFSISDKTSAQGLGVAAAVWAIVVTAACLFAGGFVASQLTVGENKREAAAYGLLVWALVFAMLLWLRATGVKAGFNAMVGVATTGAAVGDTVAKTTTQGNWEELARKGGVEQSQIDAWKQKANTAPADARATVEDPATKQRMDQAARDAGDAATRVTWYTFLGTLISMVAAAAGGYIGAGPTFRLFAMPVRSNSNGMGGNLQMN